MQQGIIKMFDFATEKFLSWLLSFVFENENTTLKNIWLLILQDWQ